MKNPFRYGSVVGGDFFCGRTQQIEELTAFIYQGQNIVLQGERRIGKTSLVCETVTRDKSRRLLLVDCMEVKSVDDLCKRILRAIIAMEQGGTRFDRLIRSLAHLRPLISMNPLTGDPSVSFDTGRPLEVDSVSQVLDLVEATHRTNPLVVFFDEFQDVLKVDDSRGVLAKLRGTIQHQSEMPYIFAGSVRNKMDEIFNHPDSPFFKSALSFPVGPLAFENFADFIIANFKTGGRVIDKDLVTQLFESSEHVTGDVQQLCEALWSVTERDETIDESTLNKALYLIYSREQQSYEIILSRLSAAYVQVLKTLAWQGGEKTNSAEFVRRAGVSNASAVGSALRHMQTNKIVFKDGSRWRFTNPFFRAWLLETDTI